MFSACIISFQNLDRTYMPCQGHAVLQARAEERGSEQNHTIEFKVSPQICVAYVTLLTSIANASHMTKPTVNGTGMYKPPTQKRVMNDFEHW